MLSPLGGAIAILSLLEGSKIVVTVYSVEGWVSKEELWSLDGVG